jgi:hypothetical protein
MKKILIILACSFMIFGCKKADDAEKLAEAQDCLDGIKNNYTAADACVEKLEDIDTPQANILKCSATLLGGGLTTTRMKAAILKLKDDSVQNKALLYMTYLAVDTQTRADDAADLCKASGSRGLIAISGAVQIGTLVSLAGGGLPANPTEADIIAAVGLIGDDAKLGEIAVNMSDSYCTKATEDTDICKELAAATAGGASAADIGAALRAALTDNH